MATENTQQTQELTEDEQFAAAVKGNPLFDGVPETADAPSDPNAAAPAAGEAAQPAGTPPPQAGDAGQPPAGDANAQAADAAAAAADAGNAAAAAGDEQPAGDEPFPGYNALSPEAREAFDKVANERKKYENDYRALHGMTAPLQRNNAELQRQHAALVARIQQLEQLERKQQDVSVAKDKAIQEFDEWAKQFPEESRAVLAMVNPLREKVTALEGSLNAARAELGNLHVERQQAALAREIGALEEVHADWRQIHDSPDYWEWLDRQSPGIQALNQSMFAGDTIELLNLFKGSHASKPAPSTQVGQAATGVADQVQQRRNQALARGTSPNVRQTESPVRGANREALSDDDAQFASLVADNPNFR